MTTIHAIQIQLTKMHVRKTKKVLYIVYNIFSHHIAHMFLPQSFDFHHFTTHIYPSHYTPLSPLPYAALHCSSLHFTSLHFTTLCYESTIYVTGFIYGDPYFVFSDTISYFVDCILVARSNIVLSTHGFFGNGMSVFFQELLKTVGLYVKECLSKRSFYKDPWKTHMHCPI
jgi:hypothetical protein